MPTGGWPQGLVKSPTLLVVQHSIESQALVPHPRGVKPSVQIYTASGTCGHACQSRQTCARLLGNIASCSSNSMSVLPTPTSPHSRKTCTSFSALFEGTASRACMPLDMQTRYQADDQGPGCWALLHHAGITEGNKVQPTCTIWQAPPARHELPVLLTCKRGAVQQSVLAVRVLMLLTKATATLLGIAGS